MGICAGDISAFMAVERLATMDGRCGNPYTNHPRPLMSPREIAQVGLAQMQDVHHGFSAEATDEAIMNVFTFKTGRYTFSLPLSVGATLAGAVPEAIDALATVGEHLGRVFQIRDDRLGIFGDSKTTGKPVGSDVRENKKTLYRSALLKRLPPESPVVRCFGRSDVAERDVLAVRQAIVDLGVDAEIDGVVRREEDAARSLFTTLRLTDAAQTAFEAFLAYNAARHL